MKRMRMIILLFVAAAVLSGCATTNNFQFADVIDLQGGEVERASSSENQPSQRVEIIEDEGDGKKIVRFSTDPYATLGVMKTQALVSGNVTIVVGVVPDIRFGEYFPGAIGGKCWAVKEEKEFYCQSILLPPGPDLRFRVAYIIEGLPEEVAKAKVMELSVTGEYLYDGGGDEFIADKKNTKDGKIRRKFISENGTFAYNLPRMDGLREAILDWNEYSTPEGILLSPLGSEEVAYIASINPQYKFMDKLIGTGDFSLKPDLAGMGTGLALDVFRAMGAPATGWDYSSMLPSRRNMGLIFEYVGKMRLASVGLAPVENTKKIAKAGKVVEKVKQVGKAATIEPKTGAVQIAETKNPKTQKFSAAVRKLAEEKIMKLGFQEDVSLSLAQKVKSGDYDKVNLSYGSHASVMLVNGSIKNNMRLQWPENPDYKFFAEKYEVDGYVLYHLIWKKQELWWKT